MTFCVCTETVSLLSRNFISTSMVRSTVSACRFSNFLWGNVGVGISPAGGSYFVDWSASHCYQMAAQSLERGLDA